MKLLSMTILLVMLATNLFSQDSPMKVKSRTERIEANPEKGFAYPYYLFTPKSFYEKKSNKNHSTLLVIPNNTGTPNDDLDFHEKSVKLKIFQAAFVFNKLDTAVLMPVFPRPKKDWKIYTHALDRDSLITRKKEFARFDLQLLAMIDDARENLKQAGIPTNPKVLMYGYSASGMFVNRFVFLHPNRVKAATIGSPGGWPIAPLESFKKRKLRYPIGIADYEDLSGRKFDLTELRHVPLFIYVGDKDTNDSVVFTDGYENEDKEVIFELFGETPVARWQTIREIYKKKNLNAVFKLYPNVDHKPSKQMRKDVLDFLMNHRN